MYNFDFIKHKNIFFTISIVIIVTGIIFYFINGLNLDVQFSGGTRMIIETNSEIDINKVRDLVSAALGKSVKTQMLQTHNPEDASKKIYMVRIDIAAKEALNDTERNLVNDIIAENFDVKENGNQEVLSVEPSIGRETMLGGLKALAVASVLIVLYVTWRFSAMSGFSAAVTALVALAHDVLIVFALYTIFKFPFDEIFITAALTILGYSINDTIIIYDRIRENRKVMRKHTLDEIVNASINQSLTRTVNTSITTLITLTVLYIFASVNNISSLVDFSLPLIIGFIAGVYSTIFIASPLWLMWRKSSVGKTLKKA